VLDEADRLLEEGFALELKEIIRACPRGRQTMLFSATLNDEVENVVQLSLNQPLRIIVDPHNAIVSTLSQEFIRVRTGEDADREAIVAALCKRTFTTKTIVFFRSKQRAHRMMIVFGLMGLKVAELHGNLSQTQRLGGLQPGAPSPGWCG
jgi:ATP-dependent RNA helicase DDX27